MEQGVRTQAHLPVFTQLLISTRLSFCHGALTSTETIGLIRDGGIMEQEVRAQTHLPVFTQLMSSEG